MRRRFQKARTDPPFIDRLAPYDLINVGLSVVGMWIAPRVLAHIFRNEQG